MTALGLVLIGLAAVFHGYVFVLESLLWTRPATRRTFGVPNAEDAEIMRPLALNQGFYNLFLAIVAVVGIVLVAAREPAAGSALALSAAGSMVGAGVVLLVSNPRMLRAALLQAAPPLLGVVALLIGLLTAGA